MTDEPMARHRIPVIDRMMDVLALLEKRNNGASIRELVEFLGLPRTTVYRILNTLQFHDVVRRTSEGAYRLGPRLLALAARTLPDANDYDLAALSRPHLEALAEKTGEGCKVSVLDGNAILVVAAVQGTREYALTVVPGQHQPLHAGAASKMLIAHLPEGGARRAARRGRLIRYTAKTLVDRKRLVGRARAASGATAGRRTAASIRPRSSPMPRRSATGTARWWRRCRCLSCRARRRRIWR